MNYIKHLTAVYEKFADDDRLNPSHVSLYMALFQFWNLNRFRNPISIARGEVMKLSKIASNKTYLKGLRELDEWDYIRYFPSRNPMKGSQVEMCNFYISTTQVVHKHYISATQVLPPSMNSNKHSKPSKREQTATIPPSLEEVKSFFKNLMKEAGGEDESGTSEKVDDEGAEKEARRFYSHYQANGWRIGKNPMQDWKAAAESWLLKAPQFNSLPLSSQNGQQAPAGDDLSTSRHKDYDEPL